MIFRPELANLPDMLKLRTAIARIAMLSQVSAANTAFGTPSTDDDIGGRRPSGGIDYKDDREKDFALRSVDYFIRRLTRCHTERAVTELLGEANETLAAYQKTPRPQGAAPPVRGSFYWKCDIADSDEPIETLRSKHFISSATIYRYRAKYRGLRKSPSDRAV